MLCSKNATKGEIMSFCNLFNSFGNGCGCNSCNNSCNRCNRCNGYYRQYIPTNTIPRPPILPPVIEPISNIGTYNTAAGSIAIGATLPLGTQYISNGTNAIYNPGANSITLSDGIYRVSYNASATGTVGTASLALYNSGSYLPPSTSIASVTVDTDVVPLGSSVVVDARNTPVTVTLVNNGDTDMTFNNVNLTATQIR